jgi:hypothetical protein
VRRLISNKTLWPLHVAQGRAEEISAWVAANGIEPDDVSTNHDLIVEDVAGVLSIRCTVYLRTLDGSKYVDGALDDAAVAERRVPLLVLPPDSWPTWALADERPQP